MMVHPPMLYSGYTLLMVPFAFAVGALISGSLSAEWIQVTRRFALAAWLCLGIGILLGLAGPTPSSAGAASGPGIRSRTPR